MAGRESLLFLFFQKRRDKSADDAKEEQSVVIAIEGRGFTCVGAAGVLLFVHLRHSFGLPRLLLAVIGLLANEASRARTCWPPLFHLFLQYVRPLPSQCWVVPNWNCADAVLNRWEKVFIAKTLQKPSLENWTRGRCSCAAIEDVLLQLNGFDGLNS